MELKNKCYFEEKNKPLSKSYTQMKGKGRTLSFLEKVEKYLIEEAKIQFPKTPEWSEMDNYRQLRNCIVHSQGTLTLSRSDQFLKDTYVSLNSQYLEISSGFYGDEVIFHQGFCELSITTVDTFFQQLYGYKDF